MNRSEEKLISDCLDGDSAAQYALYKLYAAKMLAVCKRYVRDTSEAENVLQEGFMLVFDKLTQFRFEGSFEGWIRKIMVNKAIQHCRQKASMYAVVNLDDYSDELIGTDEILNTIASKDLLNMIQELPPAYKLVFNLYVFEGYKHREIAGILGITEGTSKSNLSDARKILKRMINRSMLIAKKVNVS